MANVQAFCNQAKVDLLEGRHAFSGAYRTVDVFKIALFFETTGDIGAATTTLDAAAGECTGTGYTAGGEIVTNGSAPALDSSTAHWTPSANVTFAGITINSDNFNGALLYNSSQGNRAISAHTFTGQQIVSGDFVLTMPTPDGTNGLVRIA